MGSTTLKLPAELKERIAALVKGTDQSMHAFMVEAIAQQTLLAERRRAFVNEAKVAQKEMLRTGTGYPVDEVHAYIKARVQGRKAPRPKAEPWRK